MGFHPAARVRLAKKLWLFLALAVVVGGVVWWENNHPGIKKVSPNTPVETLPVAKPSSQPSVFDKSQHSINDPGGLWVVVNKGRILPSSYVPADLVAPKVALSGAPGSENMLLSRGASVAAEKLVAAASSEGLKLRLVSGYRSFATQQSLYSGYVSSQGRAYADATSAQPGHSEHQTGLAADLGAQSGKCQLEACFGDTAEGKWLAANAHKYGFIIRYPKDAANLTGYTYEPWHVRYVGVDLATELSKTGQTLEQFFGLPAYPDYPATSYQLKAGY